MDTQNFETAKKAVIGAVLDLLKYKNEKYGNSALEPANVFYKGDAETSIAIRLDDKIKRVMNSGEFRKNDLADLVGYLFLMLISKGGKEDGTFYDKAKAVANELYSATDNLTESGMVFSREPQYAKLADEAILEAKNAQGDVTSETYTKLATALINMMIDNSYTDLSDLKD